MIGIHKNKFGPAANKIYSTSPAGHARYTLRIVPIQNNLGFNYVYKNKLRENEEYFNSVSPDICI